MRRAAFIGVLTLAALLGSGASAAQAYKIWDAGRTFTGPTVTYHSSINRALTRRVVGAVNGARIGAKLKRASRSRADILIKSERLGCGHGYTNPVPKFDSAGRERFRTMMVIARGCNRPTELLTTTHEMAHALGLAHTRRPCSIMSFAGGRRCQKRILFSRLLFQRDDIRGMRRIWRNRAPKAMIGALQESPVAGSESRFTDDSIDGQRNIARTEWHFGDPGSAGNVLKLSTPKGWLSSPFGGQAVSHTFSRPGVFTVTLTVVDTYGKRSRATRQVSVVAPEPPSGPSEEEAIEMSLVKASQR